MLTKETNLNLSQKRSIENIRMQEHEMKWNELRGLLQKNLLIFFFDYFVG